MKTLKFLGPTHLLKLDQHEIPRGEQTVVSDAAAKRAERMVGISVEVSEAPGSTESDEDSEEEMNDGAV